MCQPVIQLMYSLKEKWLTLFGEPFGGWKVMSAIFFAG